MYFKSPSQRSARAGASPKPPHAADRTRPAPVDAAALYGAGRPRLYHTAVAMGRRWSAGCTPPEQPERGHIGYTTL